MTDVEIVVFNDKSWVRFTEYQKVMEENEQLKQELLVYKNAICNRECAEVWGESERLEKENQQLTLQIEKMKNWCNCKNYQECLIELAAQGKGMKPSECCVNCKKWELKESKRISE